MQNKQYKIQYFILHRTLCIVHSAIKCINCTLIFLFHFSLPWCAGVSGEFAFLKFCWQRYRTIFSGAPFWNLFLKPFLYYTNFATSAKNITRLRVFLLLSVMLPGGWLFLIAKFKTPWKWTVQAEEHFTWARQVFQSPYLSILFSNTVTMWWRL